MNAPKNQKELDALLCPDLLLDPVDDPGLEPDPLGLTPDCYREKKSAADDYGPEDLPTAKVETPAAAVQTPVEVNSVKISLGEWTKKWAKEPDGVEDPGEILDPADLERAFERVLAKRSAESLTPENLL